MFSFKQILNQLFTGSDNQTFDIARVLWAVGVFVFMVLSIIETFKGHDFDPVAYASGLGIALVGGGIGVAIKKDTEPKRG